MGTLSTVKALFKEGSGREDIVLGEDGINVVPLINIAQRWLDSHCPVPLNVRNHTIPVAQYQYFVIVQDLRAIYEVWASTIEGRWKLDFKKLSDFREDYPKLGVSVTAADQPPALSIDSRDAGQVLYYTESILGRSPATQDDTPPLLGSLATFDLAGTLTGDFQDYKGILLAPATDEAISLTIFGSFFSPQLENDYDKSWWTVNRPEILAWAALYQLEVLYRNSEGQADWLKAIDQALSDVDKDVVDNESARIRAFGG